jgi:hypothetical protein
MKVPWTHFYSEEELIDKIKKQEQIEARKVNNLAATQLKLRQLRDELKARKSK